MTEEAPGRVAVRFNGQFGDYHVLLSGESVLQVTTPRAAALGADGTNVLIDPDAGTSTRFYVVQRLPRSAPGDLDGDGMDDVFELQWPGVLSPLDPTDADLDADGDGISNGEEIVEGLDGFITNPLAADSDGDGVDDGAEVALDLDPSNPSDAGGDVLLDGRTVVLTGAVRFGTLTLRNGAVLTHSAVSNSTEVRLSLTVSNLVIDAGSRIDVSAQGFPGGRSRYNAGNRGRTPGDAEGSVRRAGGSHGGLGAPGDAETFVNDVYGDPFAPNELGSGGGSDSGAGGAGGGRVRIEAVNIRLDGRIAANGGDGSRYAGGGSGGSIHISADTLTGDGAIEANGGAGGVESGGGGGGRIALVVGALEGDVLSRMSAVGGSGFITGAPGTIYRRVGTGPGELVIRGIGRETILPQRNVGDRLVLDGAHVSAGALTAGEVRLINGAVLTHPPGLPGVETRLDLTARHVEISVDSRIDLTGRGFPGGRDRGNSGNSGQTIHGTVGSGRRAGGSHGGLGGTGNAEGSITPVFGDYTQPVSPGSGGGSDSGPGGAGGGALRLISESLLLNGLIIADGADGSRYAGGGAGGSIWISVDSLAGSGGLRANGGRGGFESGSGGGGRIAVYFSSADGTVVESAAARSPGEAHTPGAAGTIYLKRGSDGGRLIVRGSGRESPIPGGVETDTLLVDAATASATRLLFREVTLINEAVLTHPPASLESETRLEITAARVRIDGTSRIDLSNRGYRGGRSLPGMDNFGRTLGNAIGSARRSGGSYGGLGGLGNVEPATNPSYGAWNDPRSPGSGGGSDSGAAGSGGGLLLLNAGELILDGRIVAHGGTGSRYAGGGSGGGINIVVGNLSGSGQITANGGDGGFESGTGGGGRISVRYTDASGLDLRRVEARGGLFGYSQGSPGTVFLKGPSHLFGDLLIDGRGSNAPSRPTPIWMSLGRANSRVSTDQLVDDSADFIPGSLVGLELNPNTNQQATFTIIANGTNSIVVDPADGDLRNVSAPGAFYEVLPRIDRLTIRDLAQAEIVDADRSRPDRRGRLRATAVELLNGSVLTHPAGSTASVYGLELFLGEALTVDASSRIDVSNRGYLGGRRADNPDDPGRTRDQAGGSSRRHGGSYGGMGAIGNVAGGANAVYGDHHDAFDNGSGGGSDTGPGGSGGGRLRVIAESIHLDGGIAANGGNGSRYAGGGSGGGIRLETSVLRGSGWITADGGAGGVESGGGGGGRITLFYGSVEGTVLEHLSAAGGGGYATGAPGTIFLRHGATPGQVILRGGGRETPMPNGTTGELVILDGARVAAETLSARALRILNGAVLTHPGATPLTASHLTIDVETLVIDAASRIDVSARGYLGGRSGDNARDAGQTQDHAIGSSRRNGGSHGGNGGLGNVSGTVNPAYGDPGAPSTLGSGGGSDAGPGGNGGGRVAISAPVVELNGQILANGGGGSRYAGGGSGGSIRIDSNQITGFGSIAADGGSGGIESGGGGGGRVFIRFGRLTVPGANISAAGGTGFTAGTAGTVALEPN